MPDSYTHVSIALQALMRGGQAVASLPCFIAGANGPDPFSMYQFWRRKRRPDLAELCGRIHREKTGLFLNNLLQFSVTPEQQSFTMGFLTHYTTDCTLYPYIAALGDAGLFTGKRERLEFEASIDSELFYRNYRTRTVPVYAATPMLVGDDLGQVTTLLHDALQATYDLDMPVVHLADAYHDNAAIRKYMYAPRGGKKGWAKLTAPMRTGSKNAMPMLAKMQPGAPLPALPESWKNPYTGEEMHLTFDQVIVLAEQTGTACIVAAMSYWLGEIDETRMAGILGDNNYYTGRPNPPPGVPARVVPAPGQAAPEQAAPVPTAVPPQPAAMPQPAVQQPTAVAEAPLVQQPVPASPPPAKVPYQPSWSQNIQRTEPQPSAPAEPSTPSLAYIPPSVMEPAPDVAEPAKESENP